MLYDIAVLGKDAALVCVAFEVVDRIEDVVTEIPLMEVEVTLCLGLRSVVASSCKSASDGRELMVEGRPRASSSPRVHSAHRQSAPVTPTPGRAHSGIASMAAASSPSSAWRRR